METVGGGRYELEAEIAKGAIGTVWRGRDVSTGERVAIKQLRPEAAAQPDLVEAFLSEWRILTGLRHPCIVAARELVRGGDTYALVLDLVNGQDLRRRLRQDGPLPPAVAADVVAQVADALAYLHGQGIVHGDIKPGNILVPVDGSPVRLTDFGVARRFAPGTGGRATHATPEYVAPEVIAGQPPTPASDGYALGIVLYELLCGRSPYRGGGVSEVLYRHASCVPVRPAGFSEPLWPVILDCLAMDPAARPSTGALADRLRALLPGLDGLAPLPSVTSDMVTWWARADLAGAPAFAVPRGGPPAASAPVSPASGDSPRGTGSDLPIAELPTPVMGIPAMGTGTRYAAAAVVPVPVAEPDTPFGPLPSLVGSPARPRGDRRLMVALLGAAVLVVVAAAVGAVLLLTGGHKPVPEPGRPVAVPSSQPSTPPSKAPSTPKSEPPTDKPSAPSTPPVDTGGSTDNGSTNNDGGNADTGDGTGTIPGIGPSTPG
jgi:serine/threonine-protein kinase